MPSNRSRRSLSLVIGAAATVAALVTLTACGGGGNKGGVVTSVPPGSGGTATATHSSSAPTVAGATTPVAGGGGSIAEDTSAGAGGGGGGGSGSHPTSAGATTSAGSGGGGGGGGCNDNSPPGAQELTVTPACNLVQGQSVHVTGKGYSPNTTYVITECADEGNNTGPNNCDITSIFNYPSVTSDANGDVNKYITVDKVFESQGNKQYTVTCGSPVPCIVDVAQASFKPTQQAGVDIYFK